MLDAPRRAGEHFQAGKSLAEVARLVGASLSSVKRWRRGWKEGSVKPLAPTPHPGTPSKLTDEEKPELMQILLAGPIDAGQPRQLGTGHVENCAVYVQIEVKRMPRKP